MTYIAEDGLPEDRITCVECREHDAVRKRCRVFRSDTLADLKRRCVHFVPIASLADQRNGEQRWPGILEQIEEIRALDQAHREGRRA